MSEEFAPKNKEQAEGYQMGKTFVSGFTDQIKELRGENERLKAENMRLIDKVTLLGHSIDARNTLIDELAEALRNEPRDTYTYEPLLQSAKNATATTTDVDWLLGDRE